MPPQPTKHIDISKVKPHQRLKPNLVHNTEGGRGETTTLTVTHDTVIKLHYVSLFLRRKNPGNSFFQPIMILMYYFRYLELFLLLWFICYVFSL